MTESGLYQDLVRIVDESLRRALAGTSWSQDHVYVCPQEHRMHTVCSTLEALGYIYRRWDLRDSTSAESAWQLTEAGLELYDDLARAHRARRWRAS